MHRNTSNLLAFACLSAVVLYGCRDQRGPTELGRAGAPAASVMPSDQDGRYLVLFTAERVPEDFGARVESLGGALEKAFENVGLAVVSGLMIADAVELRAMARVRAVEPDLVVESPPWDDTASTQAADASAVTIQSHDSPTKAAFYARQWNVRAIFADSAWAAGYLGSPDVSVAILDSGIDYTHPDLVGRVDLSRSISLVPALDERVALLFPGRHPITDLHGHGTATAGLVVSNAHYLAAVTQRTTVFGVKVHDGVSASPLSVRLSGIIYAADHDADVIHMSFASTFSKKENPGLVAAVQRVINYAHRKGAVLVAPAGNTAAAQNVPGGPGDYDRDADRFRPCNADHVICVAATAPTSAAAGLIGPWQNVDAIAPYSHFGLSAIDVAAPGGRGAPGAFPALAIWVPCSQTAVTRGNPFFDCGATKTLIASSTGTSWSAAMTSGLAALLVSSMGKGRPDQISAVIEKSADDLGAPGMDARYGRGRINAARALGLPD